MFVGRNQVLLHYPLRHRTIMNILESGGNHIGGKKDGEFLPRSKSLQASMAITIPQLCSLFMRSPLEHCSNGGFVTVNRFTDTQRGGSRCSVMQLTL